MNCPKCDRTIMPYEYESEDITYDMDSVCFTAYVVCPDCKSSWLVSEVYVHSETFFEPCDEEGNVIEEDD